MDYGLIRIKRLIINGKILWTNQALFQMESSRIDKNDVIESILNSQYHIIKNTKSLYKNCKKEKVHIIKGLTYDGLLIYTKGIIRNINNKDTFYVMISSKKSEE